MANDALGMLGLPYLHSYWQRMRRLGDDGSGAHDLDFALLSGLRLGLLETLQCLHRESPSYAAFEAWIVNRNGGAIEPAALDRLRGALAGETVGPEVSLDAESGLTAEELAHWDEHGYVVVRGAVPLDSAKAAEAAIYDFLGANPDDPESWYTSRLGHTIWVPLLRHPAFWANRRSPRLVKAFAQLWGRDDLWPTIDQGGLNPPERQGWRFPGPHLHWDTTLAEPHCFGLQGILYLADCAEDQGAFTCIPGFHRTLPEWLARLPPGVDPRKAILDHPAARPIAASAGDLVVWHRSLPHGSSPNCAKRPRVAQYITLKPTRWQNNPVWR